MSDRRCRICGQPQRLEKRGRDTRDTHPCRPVGCPVAAAAHTLADGSACPDPRHSH